MDKFQEAKIEELRIGKRENLKYGVGKTIGRTNPYLSFLQFS
jgi:hypothetical protein